MKAANTDVPSEACDVADVISRIGDKWTVLVVSALSERSRRFNEIARMVAGISQRMLTLTLRSLERDGMVIRTVYPTVPPRVDYELTPLGRSLVGPISVLSDWAGANRKAILAARQRFDRARQQQTPLRGRPAADARQAAD